MIAVDHLDSLLDHREQMISMIQIMKRSSVNIDFTTSLHSAIVDLGCRSIAQLQDKAQPTLSCFVYSCTTSFDRLNKQAAVFNTESTSADRSEHRKQQLVHLLVQIFKRIDAQLNLVARELSLVSAIVNSDDVAFNPIVEAQIDRMISSIKYFRRSDYQTSKRMASVYIQSIKEAVSMLSIAKQAHHLARLVSQATKIGTSHTAIDDAASVFQLATIAGVNSCYQSTFALLSSESRKQLLDISCGLAVQYSDCLSSLTNRYFEGIDESEDFKVILVMTYMPTLFEFLLLFVTDSYSDVTDSVLACNLGLYRATRPDAANDGSVLQVRRQFQDQNKVQRKLLCCER